LSACHIYVYRIVVGACVSDVCLSALEYIVLPFFIYYNILIEFKLILCLEALGSLQIQIYVIILNKTIIIIIIAKCVIFYIVNVK